MRAKALRDAAASAGCDATLALAEIHETWDCYGDGGGDYWHEDYDEDEEGDDWSEREASRDEPEDVELGDLLQEEIQLDLWLDPETGDLEDINASVDSEEVGCFTPSSDLEPERSEYEGYMGNYGNTMERAAARAREGPRGGEAVGAQGVDG